MINSKGQTLVETALSLPIFIALVIGLLCGIYAGFVQIWIKHASYEAAICLARGEYEVKCREDLKNRVNGTLPGEPIENMELRRFKRSAQVSFQVRVLGEW